MLLDKFPNSLLGRVCPTYLLGVNPFISSKTNHYVKCYNPFSAKQTFGQNFFFINFIATLVFYAGEICMETFFLQNSLNFFIDP